MKIIHFLLGDGRSRLWHERENLRAKLRIVQNQIDHECFVHGITKRQIAELARRERTC